MKLIAGPHINRSSANLERMALGHPSEVWGGKSNRQADGDVTPCRRVERRNARAAGWVFRRARCGAMAREIRAEASSSGRRGLNRRRVRAARRRARSVAVLRSLRPPGRNRGDDRDRTAGDLVFQWFASSRGLVVGVASSGALSGLFLSPLAYFSD